MAMPEEQALPSAAALIDQLTPAPKLAGQGSRSEGGFSSWAGLGDRAAGSSASAPSERLGAACAADLHATATCFEIQSSFDLT